MEAKYNVGDIVKVINFKDCTFGVHPSMRKYVGREVQIVDVNWRAGSGAYQYCISEDDREWWWCDQCFEPIARVDLPEFEAAESLDVLLF